MQYSIASLISDRAIPGIGFASASRRRLIGALTPPLSGLAADAAEFLGRALDTQLSSDYQGIAFEMPASGHPLLTEFLRSEIALSTADDPSLAASADIALTFVDHLEIQLQRLASSGNAWRALSAAPTHDLYPITWFHSAIGNDPGIYHWMAARHHRGAIAKANQIGQFVAWEHNDPRLHEMATRLRFSSLLSSALRPVARVISAIPGGSITESMALYLSPPPDPVVWDAIISLRKLTGPDVAYSPSTLTTFWSDWYTICYELSTHRAYRIPQPPSWPQQSSPTPKRRAARTTPPESDPESSPDAGFFDAEAKQDRVEAAELKRSGQSAALSAGHAVLAYNPSRNTPGCLQMPVLAQIEGALAVLHRTWPAVNAWVAHAILHCCLHLGRRPDWLLTWLIDPAPSLLTEYRAPTCDLKCGTVTYTPSIFLGLRTALDPNKNIWRHGHYWPDAAFQQRWLENNAVYETVDLLQQLRLPVPLWSMLRSYGESRARAIIEHSRTSPASNIGVNAGPFWVWRDGADLVPLQAPQCGYILQQVSGLLRAAISEYPTLTATNLVRSFECYYNESGMGGVLRYAISERARSHVQVPARYTRLNSATVFAIHDRIATTLEGEIRDECAALDLPYVTPTMSPSITAETSPREISSFGSCHVVRVDVIRSIVRVLRAAAERNEFWEIDRGLDPNLARQNARTRLLAVMLGLSNGLRPREATLKLKVAHFSRADSTLAIRGKARGTRRSYRRLPLQPETATLVDAVKAGHPRPYHRAAQLLGLYIDDAWSPLTPADLDDILAVASTMAGFSHAPDFYSLRHRFRSDMVAAGMPEPYLRYLMGHENRGIESWNIFLEASLHDVGEVYARFARPLLSVYGFAAS